MKKFFAIAVIAASFVACNNSGEKKEGEVKDTTAPAVVDTTAPAVVDTTAPAVVDTTVKAVVNEVKDAAKEVKEATK